MPKLTPLNGNSQKLDGGAMFGNAPKALWSRWVEVDEQNRIDLACRALLVEFDEQKILLETGIGSFFEPKLKERYGVVEDEHVLLQSLSEKNISHEEIDMVILSHLHFDHAGGLLTPWQENTEPELLFPNAIYLTSQQAWERACKPHFRDRASFIPKLIELLAESNRLRLIEDEKSDIINEHFKFHESHGHTPGMLLTEVCLNESPVIFAADLIPAAPWVHLPLTMGYDRYPELLIDEKKALLEYCIQHNARLFYTHDSKVVASHIRKEENGRYSCKDPTSDLA